MIPLETIVPEDEKKKMSPDFVRISAASAMALRMRSGRFTRDFDFGGINILLNYDNGCLADCGYCGLARTRPGDYEDKSFIRVEWPLVDTDEVVDRMTTYAENMTRLCISQVTHPKSHADTIEITKKLVAKTDTPISILCAPPVLNREKLQEYKDLGVDMIGVGLDGVSEAIFKQHRTDVPNGSLKWSNYWDIINLSREIFGEWKVNVHTVVGLGESDKDMMDVFFHLFDNQIFPYLFSFNPEPDSRMGDWERADIKRWRRIQLIKHLIEKYDLKPEALAYDADGNLTSLKVDEGKINEVIEHLDKGIPFMTDGCPGPDGEVGCTRPYGSYKPSEQYRDFPFQPSSNDVVQIKKELELEEIMNK
ncbi:MAG: radical SAM protein [Cyclobacteriaceae bacterium]|nr:radical SAM protein [Cyclobacteriaceae bacterium]